jgi:ParB family transcriptional regulator, chromosome partitioning protein
VAKKIGLGHGLSALMGSEDSGTVDSPEIQKTAAGINLPKGIEADSDGQLWIDPALLKPNPHQPRQEFDESKLNELADSVKEHGIVQSITIEDAGDGSFYIIAGERRTRAARMAGLKKVPVQLRRYSEEKKLEVALIENIQRADLNPIEEAQAYYKLMEIGGLNQDEVAAKVGKNRSTVANMLRLLKLPEDMQNSLITGAITSGHARALLAVENTGDQRILFGRILGTGMSVREAEAQVAEFHQGARLVPKKTVQAATYDTVRDPDFIALEQQFIDALGTKVLLSGSMDRGSLRIEFYSRQDLDRLYTLITGNQA